MASRLHRQPSHRTVRALRSRAEGTGAELLGRDLGPDRIRGTAAWDRGSRQRALAGLQRSAGNAAVVEALTARPPASAHASSLGAIAGAAAGRPGLAVLPFPLDFEAIGVSIGAGRSAPAGPPTGARRIRSAQGGGTRAAGYTELPAPRPPELSIAQPQRVEGGWSAAVQPTANDRPVPTSLYPAPGVHEVGTNAGGQQSQVHVTPDMSDVIRQGEDEHLLDLEWARHLSYDRAASAVNAAAEAPAPVAATPEAARRLAERQVCAALPPALRWPLGSDPVRPWIRAYSRMAHVTIERDQAGWHSMTSAFVLDPAEKRALGVPVGDELTRYVGGPQIGRHPSAPLVRARFAELSSG